MGTKFVQNEFIQKSFLDKSTLKIQYILLFGFPNEAQFNNGAIISPQVAAHNNNWKVL